jgi:N-methylhydantoinase B/oxoprolinase/acetone carboxylase alpha subunit
VHELVRRRFDAVELALLWRRLISLVDEAAAALVRTSFSTLVRESYDFSCIVTDAAGESLVQAKCAMHASASRTGGNALRIKDAGGPSLTV